MATRAKKSTKKSSKAVSRFKQITPAKGGRRLLTDEFDVAMRTGSPGRKTGRPRGKARTVKLPEGFRVLGRAESHDFDKHPVVEGERGEARTVTFNRGRPNEEDRECFTIISEEFGAETIWYSAGLRELFEGSDEGDYVRIEYTHTLPPRNKGESGMRVFVCGIKE